MVGERTENIQRMTSDDSESTRAEERPLLRSFPNPSGYGIPRLPSKTTDVSMSAKLKEHVNADIDTRWADLVLIVCFFISGSIDAGAYNAYECFSSMQVG